MARATRRAILASYRAEAPMLAERYENLGPGVSLGPFSWALGLDVEGRRRSGDVARPLRVLDLGAGTGAVARSVGRAGHLVWAVEPVTALRRYEGRRLAADELPGLLRLAGAPRFDCILALGVWHHLSPPERRLAWRRLRALARPRGQVLMSVRLGPSPPGRARFPANLWSERAQARAQGFTLMRHETRASVQPGNRAQNVRWLWLWFERRC
ncbi:MAG: class I SAM-dependent methyltransferase [Pseudomonadota bacterium]